MGASYIFAFQIPTDYASHNCHFLSNAFVTFVSFLRGTLVDIVALMREYNNDAQYNCCVTGESWYVTILCTLLLHSFLWHFNPRWAFSFSTQRFLNQTEFDARYDCSGRVISLSQRPLPIQDSTTYKHKRQTSMLRAGLEPAIPAIKRPKTCALYRAANGIELLHSLQRAIHVSRPQLQGV
jgi:hypothetical protein